MEQQMPLKDCASVVRGCLATLALPLSPVAHETVSLYLAALLNDYQFSDYPDPQIKGEIDGMARLNLKARIAAKIAEKWL